MQAALHEQSLPEVLPMFVWEGVTNYLTLEAVNSGSNFELVVQAQIVLFLFFRKTNSVANYPKVLVNAQTVHL